MDCVSALAIANAAAMTQIAEAQAMRDLDERFRIGYDDVGKVRRKFRRREVPFPTTEQPGSIIFDPASKYLYFTPGGRLARKTLRKRHYQRQGRM